MAECLAGQRFARRHESGSGLKAGDTTGAQTPDGVSLSRRCYACHSLAVAERNLSGPTLRGIFGRRAGALGEFDYSLPVREAGCRGLTWTAETLDRFLEDPEEFVPGVRMTGVRLRAAGEHRALIRWLQGATR
jgi:cytochrome c